MGTGGFVVSGAGVLSGNTVSNVDSSMWVYGIGQDNILHQITVKIFNFV
jgi:hypothetical protein